MRTDAEKDPAINPNTLHARLLINEVNIVSHIFHWFELMNNETGSQHIKVNYIRNC